LLAAMVVFLGHVSGERLTGGFLWQFGPYMGQAVTVFFVLSGFVISYATARQAETARSYLLSRLARVYSVALPALVLTFVLDAVGRSVRPELYSVAWGYVADGQAWQFASGLLLVNQIWGLDVPQGSDLPFWSLGYEAWYYVIFGLAVFAPVRWRGLAVVAALAFVGPAIAVLLPLWLLGVYGFRVCRAARVGPVAGWVLCVGSLVVWVAYEAWGRSAAAALIEVPGFLRRPSLVEDHLVGGLFVAHIIGFDAISPRFASMAALVQRPIRWAAGATFTIYLLHLPVAQFLSAQVPWRPAAWETRVVLFGGTLVILFAVAEVTERQKTWWRRVFEGLLGRVLAPSAEL
jgi:peptidoglycan/LPS O-acetylase OafA/YrhL